MLATIANMFLGRRRSGLAGLFDRRRHGGVAGAVHNHRRASALGTIATLAAPFIIKKLMARRQHAGARA